jgi:hypothetical protein
MSIDDGHLTRWNATCEVEKLDGDSHISYFKAEFTCNAVNSHEFQKQICIHCNAIKTADLWLNNDSETAKRKKSDSSVPLEVPRETTASEPVQPEKPQGIPDDSREESTNVGREASAEVEKHDPTPVTPVESAHTTPSSEPFDVERMRSRIRSMSTSTRARIHSSIETTNARDKGRSQRTKRRRTRTLSSTLRPRFIPMITWRTMRSAWFIRW